MTEPGRVKGVKPRSERCRLAKEGESYSQEGEVAKDPRREGVTCAPDLEAVHVLVFDMFGTVVDWRGSVIREGEELERKKGLEVDWAALADAWRGRYAPVNEPG